MIKLFSPAHWIGTLIRYLDGSKSAFFGLAYLPPDKNIMHNRLEAISQQTWSHENGYDKQNKRIFNDDKPCQTIFKCLDEAS